MPVQLDEKARENLEVVERLDTDETGDRPQFANALASRAYYAAYQAVAHVAQTRGMPFTSEKGYYRHDSLPDEAHASGILDRERRVELEILRDLRVKADYRDDFLDREEADLARDLAGALVKELIG